MQKKKTRMPLLEKLHEYVQADPVRFHVPGHKGGGFLRERALSGVNDLAAIYFNSLLPIDVTELTGLDDLHAAESVIAEAQRLAATCFQAEHTYFLINGTTVGNLAMILGTLQEGDQVFVQRNSHQSIFNALALTRAQAIFLEPEICPIFGVPLGITVEQVRDGLKQFPQAKAIILTYPNYYGMALPLEDLIKLAHQHHLLVLVDEAHGAHFGQYASLPPSAMQLGADVSVQSTHKMLGSLTQTSMLHMQGNRVVKEDIEYYLHSLQSSSPSYPLMASLDVARAQLERILAEEWENALETYALLRQKLDGLSAFQISATGLVEAHPWGTRQDPFKLIIQPLHGNLSGYQLQQALEAKGIYTELADPLNVLCTLPIVANPEWNSRLVEALSSLVDKQASTGNQRGHVYQPKQELSCVQMEIIRQEEREELTLTQALGHIAAELIVPYPPGIPILFPGEIISQEIVEYIQDLLHQGATIQGKGKEPLVKLWVKKNKE